MTVKELIEKLEKLENKDLPIFIFDNGDLRKIDLIDALDDRIDLNAGSYE